MITDFKSEDEIVDDLVNRTFSRSDKNYIKRLPKEKLGSLHFTYGLYIRNMYHLWNEHNPLTTHPISGEYSIDRHPDTISQRILVKVWQKLQDIDPFEWDSL